MRKKNETLTLILCICAAVVCAALMYSLRFSFLSCSDSVSEFVYGRIYSFEYAYDRALNFSLQRGRFGLLFPLIVALRFKLLGLGIPAVAWALQHIPIAINVLIISVIIGRKAGREYGAAFALAFASLLQVNGWHSLITCYPLDFMYGLTIAILGFVLFYKSLGASGKKSIFLKIASAFLFYESMQTYEAFLMLSLVYGWIAIFDAFKRADDPRALGKIAKDVFTPLALHIAVALIFIGLRVYVYDHPVVPTDDGVLDLRHPGSAKGFIVTLGAFSGGMFPMADLIHPRVRSGIAEYPMTCLQLIASMISGIGAGIFVFRAGNRSESDSERKDVNASLILIGISGLITAVFFPVIHALTGVYQGWVVEGHQFGYVPTTISYFGWITFIVCIFSLFLRRRKAVRIPAAVIAGVIFAAMTLITSGINNALKEEKIGPTTVMYSYKAQAFYAVARDCICPEEGFDAVFIPDFDGVHDNLMFNEIILRYEWDGEYDVTPIKSGEEFRSEYASFDNPGVIRYDYDSDTGIVCSVDSVDEGNYMTTGDIRVVSAHGGHYVIAYTEYDGESKRYEFDLKPYEGITFENDEAVLAYSIDVTRR